MVTPAQKEEAEKYKGLGNDAFKAGQYEEAKKQYNKCISLDPDNHIYYANRAAVFSSMGNHDSALADADRAIAKNSSFAKAHSRKGKALADLGRVAEAEAAYKEGLNVEPDNKPCQDGLNALSAQKKKGSTRSSSSYIPGGGGFGGGFLQTLLDKFKKGGKMQTYMMMMAGYMLFNSYFRGSSSSSKTTDSGSETSTYGDVDAEFGSQTGRRFKDLNGVWVSYMQSDSKADSLLLLLHRTSSSAEGEYGSAFPQLAKTTASAGFRMLAPDRPCHGFSPCLSDGEPDDAATWLAPLMRIGGTPDKLAVVAAGREAAQQAIALAAKPGKAEFTHLLVVSPKALAPATQITKSAEMHDWLNKHTKKLSPQAIADAAKWAAAEAQRKQPKLAPLSVDKLPQDFRVTILYGEGDEEDEEFRQALENQGVEVKTRDAGENTLSDALADEVQQALNPDGSGVEKDQKGETDEE